MVVRDHAAALWCGVERYARCLHELLHFVPGARPDDARPGHDQRPLGLLQRRYQRRDLPRIAERARVHQWPFGEAPVDQILVDLLVEHVTWAIDVNRTRFAGHRLLQRETDLLWNTLQVDDPVDVFTTAAHQFDLIDLLEHLTAELADRARSAERHHRAAIDQRVGHAG